MREIRCPKCGEVFQVDESGYAAIVKQVRDKEFEKEIREREAQFRQEKQAAEELARTKTEQKLSGQISSQETRIRELETRLQAEKERRTPGIWRSRRLRRKRSGSWRSGSQPRIRSLPSGTPGSRSCAPRWIPRRRRAS